MSVLLILDPVTLTFVSSTLSESSAAELGVSETEASIATSS